MGLNLLLLLNVIVSALFGAGLVLLPGQLISLYGGIANPTMILVGQLYGTTQLAFAVLIWRAVRSPDSDLKRGIVLGLFVGDGLASIVSVIAQLNGVLNAMGWMVVGIHILFALGYGYATLRRPTVA